jgi:endonuclease-3
MAKPRSPRGRASEIERRLSEIYPGSAVDLCELDHRNSYELLAATILSAQCTDVRVNMVTPRLFERYPTPADLAGAEVEELEGIIRSTGFYRSKAANLVGMAQGLMTDFGGEVPQRLSDLVSLPGVGRKTGNVIRSVAFDLPGLPVDTHVGRLSRRLALTSEIDPVKVEHELNTLIPASRRGGFSLRLILHGRATCKSQRPQCEGCLFEDFCPRVGV